MKRITLATVAITAALALSACGGDADVEETVEGIWPSLPVGNGETLQATIDDYASDADCDGLQETFDTWANAATFDDRAEILSYIDDAMTGAGCY